MSSLAKFIIAGLGATAGVTAYPQEQAPSNTVPVISQPPTPSPVASSAAASASAANVALAKEALQAVTNVGRFNALLTVDGAGRELLPDDTLRSRLVFDYGARANPLGQGGRFILANQNTFPILVNQGISTAVGFLNPCSMNSPHTHPRATEFFTVIQGKFQTGFMLENGFLANATEGRQTTQVSVQELGPFQATVFPLGSIHYQFNHQCEPATFIATFNSADPGTSQVAQNYFFLDSGVVNVTLGEINQIDGTNIEQFRTSLPANLVQAVDSCLARCGIEKK
ncbi:Germin-like protein 4-1 [Cercospora beticola]|uniref:Germin-like protein 4-1 n=1 Tax=Cercospora beticola TaxID=122368 RepID=A0A2G5HU07_CERBT|nr:Germin-like protein 4-1 [Cercospora beticola]PIA96021.1 Germin-like protein 4-1 [Cercospora beticola]WPB07004.1 hypothetical protein RHO25_011664 [Cercospora beticola]CAK1366940.1 unnamed protein product [Cercospora beticola]